MGHPQISQRSSDLIRFLQSVNKLFYENTAESCYATLIFAEYEDASRRMRYANCGHYPGLLFRRDGTFTCLDSTSTVIGLFQDWRCEFAECQLLPGDTLALYTDGVTDTFNDAGEEFGEQRLIEAVRKHLASSPQSILNSLLDEVRQFSPYGQHDDMTMIVAKCRA